MRRACVGAALLAFVLVGAPAHTADAANLYSYDLDSLVFMSEHIVRGRIGGRDDAGPVPANQLVVTATHFGSLKPGDTVPLAALDFFVKSSRDERGPRTEVGEGDEVFVFLARAKKAFAFDIPDDAVVYIAVPSGLKVVADGKACGFRQQNNPGSYVMDPPATSPTLEALEAQCAQAIARVRPVAERLSRDVTVADVPWLLQLLRERRGVADDRLASRSRDAISERACARLAELKDLPALDEALQSTTSRYAYSILARGFDSAAGRAYLFRKLSDPARRAAPADQRRRYAAALDEHANVPPPAERFFEQTAELAAALAGEGDEATALILLSDLRSAVRSHEQAKRERQPFMRDAEPDLAAALKVLKGSADRFTSARLRYELDVVWLSADPDLGFAAPSAPVTAIVTVPSPGDHFAIKPDHLSYGYTVFSGPAAKGSWFEAEVVVEDERSGRSFVLTKQSFAGGVEGSGGEMLKLLPEVTPGRYRVFLRSREDGKPIGYGVETELPQARG